MADFAGAAAALRAALRAATLTGSPPIAEPNDGQPWPPHGADGAPVPWIFLQIQGNSGDLRGAGLPGNHAYLDLGHIFIHVFVPEGYGQEDAEQIAVAAGNVFRSKTFYTDFAGAKVVCQAPFPPNAGAISVTNLGDQYGVTVAVPFEFLYFA